MSDGTIHAGVRYRPDIDGLRAIAVVAVVLYHAGFTVVGGGYVGVDVFFVISGYLIMSVIAADIAASRYSLASFYERRTRRIVPALSVVVLFCLVAATILFPPARLAAFGRSLLAVALFASNFYFRGIATEHGYFDEAAESQLLLHTWSLAVEEQFYLLLPVVLALLGRFRPRLMKPALTLLALASFAWSTYTVGIRPNYAFYIVFPRAWELLAGSLLALGLAPPAPANRWARELIAGLGISLLFYSIFALTKDTVFPGPAALWPVAGTVLVIYAGLDGRPSLVARALSWRPVVFVGLISYSLYLWHWPLIVLTRYLATEPATAEQMSLALVAAAIMAVLSYYLVEQPFRGRRALFTRRGVAAAGGAVLVGACLASVVVMATNGIGQRFDAASREAMANNLHRLDENILKCLSLGKATTSPTAAAQCRIAGNGTAGTILFWGDSHVVQFRPLIERLSKEGAFGGREVRFATAGGCQPSPRLNHFDKQYQCSAFSRTALELIAEPDVQTVFLGFSAWFAVDETKVCLVDALDRCVHGMSGREVAEVLAAGIRDLGTKLAARHVAFIVMLPTPSYTQVVPNVEINRLTLGRLDDALVRLGLVEPLNRNDHLVTRDIVSAAARDAGATIFDPRTVLCHNGNTCLYERDQVSIYSDTSHIASTQVDLFHDAMAGAFRQALAGR